MKLNGKPVPPPKNEYAVFPRESGDVVFHAKAVLNYDDLEKLCPEPQPPVKVFPNGDKQLVLDHPEYKKKLEDYQNARFAWLILQSLSATPNLTWDTVIPGDPTTWVNYRKELTDSGFTTNEINVIIRAVMSANSLDESKLEEARKRFLASLATQ